MKLITKEPNLYVYDCKYINFIHDNIDHKNEIELVLQDGTIEYEEISNIDYIKV